MGIRHVTFLAACRRTVLLFWRTPPPLLVLVEAGILGSTASGQLEGVRASRGAPWLPEFLQCPPHSHQMSCLEY